MKNKNISQMTNEEILRQQLQLLAERSQSAPDEELPALTNAIVETYSAIQKYKTSNSNIADDFIMASKQLKDELGSELEKVLDSITD